MCDDVFMSNDLEFRCPVCRAAQTLRQECRRCRADLTLVERAHRRVAWLMTERGAARADGDLSREQVITAELQQFAPARFSPAN
jgi:primosomal protein N'